jgi:hypothetical protein
MAPLTTIAELQALLRWQDITEMMRPDGIRVFTVQPTDRSLPSIVFLFDDQVTLLQLLGFGPWHGHYEQWSDERRNVRRAIATARTLVSGSRYLAVQRGAGECNGYIGSSILRRSEIPRTLAKEFCRLERFAFNAPVEHIAIDLAQYHRTKDGSFIEHGWRRKVKGNFAALSWDATMFD